MLHTLAHFPNRWPFNDGANGSTRQGGLRRFAWRVPDLPHPILAQQPIGQGRSINRGRDAVCPLSPQPKPARSLHYRLGRLVTSRRRWLLDPHEINLFHTVNTRHSCAQSPVLPFQIRFQKQANNRQVGDRRVGDLWRTAGHDSLLHLGQVFIGIFGAVL